MGQNDVTGELVKITYFCPYFPRNCPSVTCNYNVPNRFNPTSNTERVADQAYAAISAIENVLERRALAEGPVRDRRGLRSSEILF